MVVHGRAGLIVTDGRPAILVTGGASGIGLAIVRAVMAEGWRAIVADLDPDSLARADAALGGGPDLLCDRLDVSDEAAVVGAVARWDAEFGPLTGLVNSAGIGQDVPCLDTGADLFRRILDVNLVGSFVVAREVAKAMRARGRGGAIVNVASVSGLRGNQGRVAYGASKGGVVTMTEVMAVELAPLGIRVNAIAPGPIETPLVAAMHTAETRDAWTRAVPQGRYARPDEVAGAAIFLLDPARSGFVTGHTLAVDGGFSTAGMFTRGPDLGG